MDPLIHGMMCNVTGWFGAHWYRVLNIHPPKIHPAVAFIHGATSATITQIAYYVLDKSPYQITNEQYLKKRTVKVIIWISAIIVTQLFINYLNLNYLKLTQINEKIIPLRPITLRDSFLMESVATGLYLFYSLIQSFLWWENSPRLSPRQQEGTSARGESAPKFSN